MEEVKNSKKKLLIKEIIRIKDEDKIRLIYYFVINMSNRESKK